MSLGGEKKEREREKKFIAIFTKPQRQQMFMKSLWRAFLPLLLFLLLLVWLRQAQFCGAARWKICWWGKLVSQILIFKILLWSFTIRSLDSFGYLCLQHWAISLWAFQVSAPDCWYQHVIFYFISGYGCGLESLPPVDVRDVMIYLCRRLMSWAALPRSLLLTFPLLSKGFPVTSLLSQ